MKPDQDSTDSQIVARRWWSGSRLSLLVLMSIILYLLGKYFFLPTHSTYSDEIGGFQPYHITPTPRGHSSLEIAIVIIITKGSDPNDYKTALNTLECYSALHGYRLIVEHDDRFSKCSKHLDKFFRRHCHTHQLMLEELPEDSWVFFIDADNAIVNPDRLIDDLIDPDYDIYLYNRFFNWEMAAQYLVKNNDRGRDWVKRWAEYEFKLPASTHGSDNGALHVLMLHYLAPETAVNTNGLAQECLSIWDKAAHIDHLFNMESCVRMVIGERTYFPEQRVKILPKTISWAHDLWQLHSHWSTADFMVHAVKEKNGTETWIFDTRLKINERLHMRMLEQMSDRVLRQQINYMVNSDADPRRDQLFV